MAPKPVQSVCADIFTSASEIQFHLVTESLRDRLKMGPPAESAPCFRSEPRKFYNSPSVNQMAVVVEH